jgi:hypothetical protein
LPVHTSRSALGDTGFGARFLQFWREFGDRPLPGSANSGDGGGSI